MHQEVAISKSPKFRAEQEKAPACQRSPADGGFLSSTVCSSWHPAGPGTCCGCVSGVLDCVLHVQAWREHNTGTRAASSRSMQTANSIPFLFLLLSSSFASVGMKGKVRGRRPLSLFLPSPPKWACLSLSLSLSAFVFSILLSLSLPALLSLLVWPASNRTEVRPVSGQVASPFSPSLCFSSSSPSPLGRALGLPRPPRSR